MQIFVQIILLIAALIGVYKFRDKIKGAFRKAAAPAQPATPPSSAPADDAKALVQKVHDALAAVRADEQATGSRLAMVKAETEARLATLAEVKKAFEQAAK